MLWTAVAVVTLAVLLPTVTCYSPRLQWIDSDDILPQELLDEPTWRIEAKRELGNELMAEKRALSVLSRWKPFSETFRTSGGRPSRGDYLALPRGVELVSAETRGTTQLRPHGQPLRWGRR